MKEVICICCPKGCHLQVDEQNDYAVTGNGCPNGIAYGKEELTNPTRIVTSTVRAAGGLHPRCAVKTTLPVPQGMKRHLRHRLGHCRHPRSVRQHRAIPARRLKHTRKSARKAKNCFAGAPFCFSLETLFLLCYNTFIEHLPPRHFIKEEPPYAPAHRCPDGRSHHCRR